MKNNPVYNNILKKSKRISDLEKRKEILKNKIKTNNQTVKRSKNAIRSLNASTIKKRYWKMKSMYRHKSLEDLKSKRERHINHLNVIDEVIKDRENEN